MKKYALVLSGGGFRGAFQLGAIKYLKENWHKITNSDRPMIFDYIVGVSAGSLNGVLLAMDKFDLLTDLWDEVAQKGTEVIYTSPFFETKNDQLSIKLDLNALKKILLPDFNIEMSFWKGIGYILGSKEKKNRIINGIVDKAVSEAVRNFSHLKSIADNSPLHDRLKRIVDKSEIKNTEYLCGFVSLNDGEYYATSHTSFTTNEDFVDAILASTAMPVVWSPVESIQKGNTKLATLVDGGIKNVSPLGDVINLMNRDYEEGDEYEVIIINCGNGVNPHVNAEEYNIAEIALRSLYEISFAEIFRNDLEHFLQVNDITKQVNESGCEIDLKYYSVKDGKRTDRSLKNFKAYIIQPTEEMNLGNPLTAGKEMIEKRINWGYEQAKNVLEKNNIETSVPV